MFCLSTQTIHCQTCLHYFVCVYQLTFALNTRKLTSRYFGYCLNLSVHTMYWLTCMHYVGCVYQLNFVFFLNTLMLASWSILDNYLYFRPLCIILSYLTLIIVSCSFNCIPRNVEGRYQYTIYKFVVGDIKGFDAKARIVPLCHLSRRYRLDFVVLS